LLEDTEGRGQGLGKDSRFVRESVRDKMKIMHGKREVFGEAAVSIQNPQDAAPGAMVLSSPFAVRTTAAGGVDFSHNPFADDCRIRGRANFADKFVTGDALKSHVALGDLVLEAFSRVFKVGATDSGEADLD